MRWSKALVVSASATLALSSIAVAAVTQKGNLRVSVDGQMTPRRLPRKADAPISVLVGWQISSVDGSPPPKLRDLSIEINRHGRLQTAGLPTCPYGKIQPASTQRALANCRSSLVGRGTFTAEVALKGQEESETYEATGTLLFFNGESNGKPVLFGQIYSAYPFATSFVIPFDLGQRVKGSYGTQLSATIPRALRSWGNLTEIQMRLSRRYGYRGRRRSFLSASCPTPTGLTEAVFPLARTSFDFVGGARQSLTVVRSCHVRK